MRQGNEFSQWVDKDKDGSIFLKLPWEIMDDWRDKITVDWIDNGDGTYTLKPKTIAQSCG